jgi:hypothetical protein
MMAFDYDVDFDEIDFRERPDLYRVGRGEQGVLLVEPYKSELLPLWKFKTPEHAKASTEALYQKYLEYKEAGDFVGMDMARKYLQMGFTRSRRYAKRRSGRKYDDEGNLLPEDPDEEKAASARIFRKAWTRVREDEAYLRLKKRHRERHEAGAE